MRLLLLLALALTGCAEVKSRYPLLKTRHAGQQDYPCGHRLAAEDFCTNFEASEALKSDPNATRVKIHCMDFYREAVNSTNLLCGYFEEIDALSFWGEGEDSPTLSAKGKRIHRKYAELAQVRSRELERAYTAAGGRGVRGAVEELSYAGRQSIEAELDCREVPGRAEGLLLLGLSAQARHDEKLTYDHLQSALTLLSGATSLEPARPYLALRERMSIDTHDDSYDHSLEKIVAQKLDAPSLLALGMKEMPPTPELERLYADDVKRAGGQTTPEFVRGISTGRALASQRCPGR